MMYFLFQISFFITIFIVDNIQSILSICDNSHKFLAPFADIAVIGALLLMLLDFKKKFENMKKQVNQTSEKNDNMTVLIESIQAMLKQSLQTPQVSSKSKEQIYKDLDNFILKALSDISNLILHYSGDKTATRSELHQSIAKAKNYWLENEIFISNDIDELIHKIITKFGIIEHNFEWKSEEQLRKNLTPWEQIKELSEWQKELKTKIQTELNTRKQDGK